MINLYIDALAKGGHMDAIDRILEEQALELGDMCDQETGERCIRGIVEDYRLTGDWQRYRSLLEPEEQWALRDLAYRFARTVSIRDKKTGHSWPITMTVHARNDRLVQRFGAERILRAYKQRAAKWTRVPELEQEQAGVA